MGVCRVLTTSLDLFVQGRSLAPDIHQPAHLPVAMTPSASDRRSCEGRTVEVVAGYYFSSGSPRSSRVSAEPPLLGFSTSLVSSASPVTNAAETLVIHLVDAVDLYLAKLASTSGIDRFADTELWRRLPTRSTPPVPPSRSFAPPRLRGSSSRRRRARQRAGLSKPHLAPTRQESKL